MIPFDEAYKIVMSNAKLFNGSSPSIVAVYGNLTTWRSGFCAALLELALRGYI